MRGLGLARLAVLAAVVLTASAPSVVQASDPVSTSAPTCADRYPPGGPAGIDLRVACALGEVVGLATGSGEPADPEGVAAGLRLVALGAAALAAVLLGLRMTGRLAVRVIAPGGPPAAWPCPACHSVNPASSARCYACRTMRPPGSVEVGPPRRGR
jgi:hypothetical protein